MTSWRCCRNTKRNGPECLRIKGHDGACSTERLQTQVVKATKKRRESVSMRLNGPTLHTISWCFECVLACGHTVSKAMTRRGEAPKKVICTECFPK
jgi:hypothetical protein